MFKSNFRAFEIWSIKNNLIRVVCYTVSFSFAQYLQTHLFFVQAFPPPTNMVKTIKMLCLCLSYFI